MAGTATAPSLLQTMFPVPTLDGNLVVGPGGAGGMVLVQPSSAISTSSRQDNDTRDQYVDAMVSENVSSGSVPVCGANAGADNVALASSHPPSMLSAATPCVQMVQAVPPQAQFFLLQQNPTYLVSEVPQYQSPSLTPIQTPVPPSTPVPASNSITPIFPETSQLSSQFLGTQGSPYLTPVSQLPPVNTCISAEGQGPQTLKYDSPPSQQQSSSVPPVHVYTSPPETLDSHSYKGEAPRLDSNSDAEQKSCLNITLTEDPKQLLNENSSVSDHQMSVTGTSTPFGMSSEASSRRASMDQEHVLPKSGLELCPFSLSRSTSPQVHVLWWHRTHYIINGTSFV